MMPIMAGMMNVAEENMSLDVLTLTFKDAPRIIERNWKKIED